MESDYIKKYNDFWKAIVEKDGIISRDQVARELSDFSQLINNLSKLYSYITGGTVSKPMTNAEPVLKMFEEQLQEAYQRGYADCINDNGLNKEEVVT